MLISERIYGYLEEKGIVLNNAEVNRLVKHRTGDKLHCFFANVQFIFPLH